MELDKICRLCLTIKKDMANLFSNNILEMLNEFCNTMKVEKVDGWPEKICKQCLNQVSRCHSFKKKIEKSDEQLKRYVKSITIVVESEQEKPMQQEQQQIQQIHHHHQPQRNDPQPIIIANVGHHHQPTLIANNGQQLFHSNGQIIGQFNVAGHNNAVMIPMGTQQLLTLPDMNRCELMSDQQYFEEIPIVIQSNNGQQTQTILNLPHQQVQTLQQIVNNPQQHTQIQQVVTAVSEESDDAEIHEYDYEEMDETIDTGDETQTYIVENIEAPQEMVQETLEQDEKKIIEEFLMNQQTHEPGKYTCSLCSQEFKHMKWLHSHLKSIHINWIKANCKKQPQCSICNKSFRGPGMLKMHMKTHEKEFKLPTCTVCGKEFKSKSILYRHRATHFATQKQHKCTICDKLFSSNNMLVAHMNRHDKNNQCQNCEKHFSTDNDLKNHLDNCHVTTLCEK